MKTLLSYTMAVLFATILAAHGAPSEKEMLAKENSAWQAFKDKDAAAFQKVVDKDCVGVYSDGIGTMKDELDSMKTSKMKSFAISNFKGHMVGDDVFVTSYTVTLVEPVNGKDSSVVNFSGSVWKMQNGDWSAIFHTNAQKKEIQSTSATD
jgi:hypothetical protein